MANKFKVDDIITSTHDDNLDQFKIISVTKEKYTLEIVDGSNRYNGDWLIRSIDNRYILVKPIDEFEKNNQVMFENVMPHWAISKRELPKADNFAGAKFDNPMYCSCGTPEIKKVAINFNKDTYDFCNKCRKERL